MAAFWVIVAVCIVGSLCKCVEGICECCGWYPFAFGAFLAFMILLYQLFGWYALAVVMLIVIFGVMSIGLYQCFGWYTFAVVIPLVFAIGVYRWFGWNPFAAVMPVAIPILIVIGLC